MAAIDMPQDMPDISMPEFEDEDIDQLDDITLAEAIREARRRKRIRRLQPASARQASAGSPPPSPTSDPENQRLIADPITPNNNVEHMQHDHRGPCLVFKVHWAGYTHSDDTWQTYQSIQRVKALDDYARDNTSFQKLYNSKRYMELHKRYPQRFPIF